MRAAAANMALETTPAAGLRRALAGLALAGLILALPGALLPFWGHHLTSQYELVGTYFLALNLGNFLALQVGRVLVRRLGVRGEMLLASVMAVAGFLGLVFSETPVIPLWRQTALFTLGCAAGLVYTAVFRLIAPFYDRAPAAIMNLCGILFGAGSLLAALLGASVIETSFLWLPPAICALIAGGLLYWYARRFFASAAEPPAAAPAQPAAQENRSLTAFLFTLLLFFQAGNEWSVAGWLTLFLIQRLGTSPQDALGFLAFYWAALLLGRVAAQWVLPRVRHSRLLIGSGLAAMLGCTILSFTNNLFGAGTAILLLGSGFAMIFPLVLEKAGTRVPFFHPARFDGLFTVAITGGLLAPALVGLLTNRLGIGAALLVPLVGTIAVFLLLLLSWVEAKLNPVE